MGQLSEVGTLYLQVWCSQLLTNHRQIRLETLSIGFLRTFDAWFPLRNLDGFSRHITDIDGKRRFFTSEINGNASVGESSMHLSHTLQVLNWTGCKHVFYIFK